MEPSRNEARRCIAIMNSVALSIPLISVSARFHILTRTSLGSSALSKMDFAVVPASGQPTLYTCVLRFPYRPATHFEHLTPQIMPHNEQPCLAVKEVPELVRRCPEVAKGQQLEQEP